MNQAPRSWLLPSALVTYVALSAILGPVLYGRFAQALTPLQIVLTSSAVPWTAWGLREVARRARLNQLGTHPRGPSWFVVGLGLTLATSTADDAQAALLAAMAVGRGLMTAGALTSVGAVIAKPSILKDHPVSASRDAVWTSVIVWSTVATVHLLRANFPQQFPLDPIALELSMSFASFGSLLLLLAVVLRLKLLRGLQLGVFDRTWSALSISVAGITVGAGSGFILLAPTHEVVGWVLAFTALCVTLAMAHPDPGWVARTVRGTLVSLVLSTPACLILLWATSQGHLLPTHLALISTMLGLLLGVFSRRLARPLLPDGSRWSSAIEQALEASLHPEPDLALREALVYLRKAEPSSQHRPEIFRVDPSGLLSVDVAGYLEERPVEFPHGITEAARHEPLSTLRVETLRLAQVRTPSVRPLLQWFEAHNAKTASVLAGDTAPVGLLVMPSGHRRSPLSMEEATLLNQLCHRLAGLLSVTSALKRSRQRELQHQHVAENAQRHLTELGVQLQNKTRWDQVEALTRAESIYQTANSPAAQVAMMELEANAHGPRLMLDTLLGIDPVPWAAHVHLKRFSEPRSFLVWDMRSMRDRMRDFGFLVSEASPLLRAHAGTLALLHPEILDMTTQETLALALESHRPDLLISCTANRHSIGAVLMRELSGPAVRLPSLAERAEDLQSLVIGELSQRGLEQRGAPYGIERAALLMLIERDFFGNDDELRGLIAALCGRCSGDRVTLTDVHEVLRGEASSAERDFAEPIIEPPLRRTRSRLPPRSRRP